MIRMCRQNYRYTALPAGAWLDSDSLEEKPSPPRDTDLSYWAEMGMCYQPEWFPLGADLSSGQ